ncbi:pentatricopeptide repeat-containing protein At5g16640, mitochondrial-like isoform X2 [Papaver somniferum]|uniref:pentatricopeptide repeat-containing protein At5g16640, mitochondrial-like isoform X2 n=1 Tax=Papaver somniferum TaxID=3469 RepID=UPI000E6F7AF1|nr:pentatricopeptide repeat-containing protein At5g16640, mitochondrial-like isoform X2 [Papaver somniferum]
MLIHLTMYWDHYQRTSESWVLFAYQERQVLNLMHIHLSGLCTTGRVGLAIALKNKMGKWNCSPNVVSYSAIIDALCKGGLVEEALVLFSEMLRDSSVVPNVVVYNSLINGLCNSGRLCETKKLLDEMAKRRIYADQITYNSIIHGHCHQLQHIN